MPKTFPRINSHLSWAISSGAQTDISKHSWIPNITKKLLVNDYSEILHYANIILRIDALFKRNCVIKCLDLQHLQNIGSVTDVLIVSC